MTNKFNIKMLKNQTGCDDGINPKLYKKGETYEVGESLFNSFKNMESCKLVEGEKEKIEKTPVKENKAEKTPVKENKKDSK